MNLPAVAALLEQLRSAVVVAGRREPVVVAAATIPLDSDST